MSLSKFLKIEDVRKKFQECFSKTRFAVKKEILAPPLTKNYGRVGTAFDYLLHFYLKESRGIHYNLDYPNKSEMSRPTTLRRPW